jgi:hypothetical protein
MIKRLLDACTFTYKTALVAFSTEFRSKLGTLYGEDRSSAELVSREVKFYSFRLGR